MMATMGMESALALMGGVARPQGAECDIGAFDLVPGTATVPGSPRWL